MMAISSLQYLSYYISEHIKDSSIYRLNYCTTTKLTYDIFYCLKTIFIFLRLNDLDVVLAFTVLVKFSILYNL